MNKRKARELDTPPEILEAVAPIPKEPDQEILRGEVKRNSID